ncbi:hypothetical protein [Mycolicibacterium mucogenicum]|uniref:Uncharacterized protein n=1 Tax=Mycolicibacterium mucogenicum TaxID=56689 RepID=A0A4V3AVT7_MYCMU|nr:hypothetical protein [Mycolicibacterium mucogenicum]TDK87113.1 hypothetical protein EUA03_18035 [Mycolicibacterium mucogenicum]
MTTSTPTDALYMSDWELINHPDDYRRHYITGHKVTVTGDPDLGGTASLNVQGEQDQHGHVTRYVYLDGSGAFTAAQLRTLAAECLNMADQLDG